MKKVMMTLGAVALVAMFAACGGNESKAKDFAKKACDCKEDAKCLEQVAKDMTEAFKDIKDTAELSQLNKVYEDALKECSKEGDKKAE